MRVNRGGGGEGRKALLDERTLLADKKVTGNYVSSWELRELLLVVCIAFFSSFAWQRSVSV